MIETPRMRIVPFQEHHLTDRYVGWLNDPEVVRFSDQRFRRHTISSCRDYWSSFGGTDNHFLAIEARDPSLGHIGNINVYIEARDETGDVGILLGERSIWGKGYGSEAWIAVCDYLLRQLGLRKVTAGTLSVNEGMVAIMRRAGMLQDGRRVRQQIWEGHEVDVVYAALFRDAHAVSLQQGRL